ncbi:MAG: DHH family phosphoesterase [Candidatus Improbicoccus pseudotrichonymphae]|uniref:DHH family phosphoesterase n=1 Tax=Candidatus Improbicoccus pseudotrichonymphae TaxID=3033792 RepID=A0AA48HVM7_9FIRM|nr:MAG: DHH family phosphoesterase [Candidatus Improbicoccus pseudotrichonymphae]
MNVKKFGKIIEIISKCNDFCILSHLRPDGDSIGSSMALYLALKKLKKRVCVVVPEEAYIKYDFLLRYLDTRKSKKKTIISIDTADISLLYNPENLKIDICIDHHITNKGYAKLNYINCISASNSINIYHLLENMKVKIDRKIAECIFTGILTDTARYKNLNVNEEVFKISSILYPMINYNNLNKKIFKQTKFFFDLKCKILSRVEYFFDDKCSVCTIRLKTMNKCKEKCGELDVASSTLVIENVMIAVTIKEESENFFKVSVRSNGDLSVLELCRIFKGGGHKNAGGFFVKGELSEIKQKILSSIKLNIENF